MNKELSKLNKKIDWILKTIASESGDPELITEVNSLVGVNDGINKYGFTGIKTLEGGRNIPYWKAYMNAQAETGNRHWIELNNEFKDHMVIVNLDLTTKLQHKIFHSNHNRNHGTTHNRLKAYSNVFKPAADLIRDAFNVTKRDKKNRKIMGTKIPGHLVANASNHNYPYDDGYESYLKNVSEALIRFINIEYERRSQREALQLK